MKYQLYICNTSKVRERKLRMNFPFFLSSKGIYLHDTFTEDVITSIDSDILLNAIIRLTQWRGLFTKE